MGNVQQMQMCSGEGEDHGLLLGNSCLFKKLRDILSSYDQEWPAVHIPYMQRQQAKEPYELRAQ